MIVEIQIIHWKEATIYFCEIDNFLKENYIFENENIKFCEINLESKYKFSSDYQKLFEKYIYYYQKN